MHDKACRNFALSIGGPPNEPCVLCGHSRTAHFHEEVEPEEVVAEKKFTFTVNAKQMYVIRAALDLYARMGMGQLDVSVGEFLQRNFSERVHRHVMTENLANDPDFIPTPVLVRHIVTVIVNELKKAVFGHPPNGSWGIFNEDVPEVCREAYDIRQIVGQQLHTHRMEECKDDAERQLMGWDIDARPYNPTNPGEDAVDIKMFSGEASAAAADRIREVFPLMDVFTNMLKLEEPGCEFKLMVAAVRADGSGRTGPMINYDEFMTDLKLLVGEDPEWTAPYEEE